MCFNVDNTEIILNLCNQPVSIIDHDIYLGNVIVTDILDRSIGHTVRTFYQKSNHVISDFSMLDSFSLHRV